MNAFCRDIQEFHQKFELPPQNVPGFLSPEYTKMRLDFLQEELMELVHACGFKKVYDSDTYWLSGTWQKALSATNLHEALDALVDLQYVLLGTAYLMGFFKEARLVEEVTEDPDSLPRPVERFTTIFEEAWARVQKANMLKVRAKSADESKRKSSFDVVKPAGWKAPDFTDLLNIERK